uniref:(northern house mosquito) hypothetical protein n=1 Tax=Culex pipiens TaxID=7175 RepID=A0A8D8DZ25_CULPI
MYLPRGQLARSTQQPQHQVLRKRVQVLYEHHFAHHKEATIVAKAVHSAVPTNQRQPAGTGQSLAHRTKPEPVATPPQFFHNAHPKGRRTAAQHPAVERTDEQVPPPHRW